MRKHLLVITTVALVFFLVGTMFSTNYLAIGGKPSSVWDAIYALQAKVDSLNASLAELNNRVNNLEEHFRNTTKITMIIEMTSSYIHMKFNGLSIENVYTYAISDRNLLYYWFYPEIQLTWINIERVNTYREYIRLDIPLDVFISNETVGIVISAGNYASEVEYTSVTIQDKQNNPTYAFNRTISPYGGFTEEINIPASAFFP